MKFSRRHWGSIKNHVTFQDDLVGCSLPLTDIKLIPLSLETALASRVLPHPGGPAIRIP